MHMDDMVVLQMRVEILHSRGMLSIYKQLETLKIVKGLIHILQCKLICALCPLSCSRSRVRRCGLCSLAELHPLLFTTMPGYEIR
jgi:hypothetical protein